MRSFILILLLSSFPASDSAGGKSVDWWLGSYDTQYADLNTHFIRAHPNVTNGVLHCCTGPRILANGTVSVNETLFRVITQAELHMALPVMLPLSPAIPAILNETAVHSVPELVGLAIRLGITGYVIDYEPRQQENEAHAKLFATFLKTLASSLHQNNLKLDLCVSSWGILKPRYYHLFAEANCDRYISMGSTYGHQGPGNIEGIAYVEAMLAAFPKESITVGIGSMVQPSCGNWTTGDYKWDASSITSFLAFLSRRGT